MKLLIWGDKYFSEDMAWGFKELGHDVQMIAPKTTQELDASISSFNPDLVLTLGSPSVFDLELLRYFGNRPSSPMKCIHWDTDGITWMDIELRHINLIKPDIVFTVCPEMLDLLQSHNIDSKLLFYAYSPIFHHPGPVATENKDQITFVGAAYPEVIQKFPNHFRRLSMDVLFKPLLNGGYKIDFYGDNRHKQVIKFLYDYDVPDAWLHGRYAYEKTCQIYNSCSINLVVQNHENTLTKRVFEILGSGGFALSYDNSMIRKFFSPGKDLVVSSSPAQTIEIVEYYKKHTDEYKTIRDNALESAQNHTYKQRAEYIINNLQKN